MNAFVLTAAGAQGGRGKGPAVDRKKKRKANTPSRVTPQPMLPPPSPAPTATAHSGSSVRIVEGTEDTEAISGSALASRKKARPEFVSQPSAPASDSPVFAGESVLLDDKCTLGRDFLLQIPNEADRQLMGSASPATLAAQWASSAAQYAILSAGFLSQWEQDRKRASDLTRETLRLRKELEGALHSLNRVGELERRLTESTQECGELHGRLSEYTRRLESDVKKARDAGRQEGLDLFPETEQGKAFLESYFESRIPSFLRSDRFRQAAAGKALRFYYHGFNFCRSEILKHGCRKGEAEDLHFLDEMQGLRCLPSDSEGEEEDGESGGGPESPAEQLTAGEAGPSSVGQGEGPNSTPEPVKERTPEEKLPPAAGGPEKDAPTEETSAKGSPAQE